jgi:hypothetical protein
MKAGFTESVRTRGFAIAVHVALWVLLYLALSGFRAQPPEYHEAEASSTQVQSPVPVAKLDQLFSAAPVTNVLPPTNVPSLFFTKYFVPTQAPALPPPTTRKIELTYEGFYQTAEGTPQTMVRLGDGHIVSALGARVASNLFVAAVTMQTLTLTNPARQTNLLPLNVKKAIEVPLK